jgi:hypothetical protein
MRGLCAAINISTNKYPEYNTVHDKYQISYVFRHRGAILRESSSTKKLQHTNNLDIASPSVKRLEY